MRKSESSLPSGDISASADGAERAPVSVMDNGRYLLDAEGEPFIVIGCGSPVADTAIIDARISEYAARGYGEKDWEPVPAVGKGLFSMKKLREDFQAGHSRMITVETLDDHLRDLSAAGVNTWRTWVQNPHFGYLEPEVGKYDETHAAKVDRILDVALKHNIKVMLTPWDTWSMHADFSQHPYSSAKGGPCAKANDMLTNRTAIEAEKKLFEYMIDRWGRHRALFGFDIMNEINWALSSTDEQQRTWVKEIAAFVKQYELKKLGYVHILTCSPNSSHGSDALYLDESLSVVNTHFYDIKPVTDDPDPWGASRAVAEAVQYSLTRNPNRPYFDNEHSPFHTHSLDFENMRETEHCTMWAQFASGAAGTGLRFYIPYHNSELPGGIEKSWAAVKAIVPRIDWRTFESKNAASRVKVPEDVFAAACADSKTLFAWLLKRAPGPGGVEIAISGLNDGDHTISFFDDTTGKIVDTPRTFQGTEFAGKTPAFDRHIALIVDSK